MPSFPAEDAPVVLRSCEAEGLEGLVFKRLASPYRSTRSHDWRKVKCSAWADYAEQRRRQQPWKHTSVIRRCAGDTWFVW